jgi:hypothetical protein
MFGIFDIAFHQRTFGESKSVGKNPPLLTKSKRKYTLYKILKNDKQITLHNFNPD